MSTAKLYNQQGEAQGEVKLNPDLFAVEMKPELVQQALLALEANRRLVLAHAKTRGEVRGGGRKPWRQKGTGRARQGSIRSPLWRGGAVTFGPTRDANFTVKINKKMNRKAILMALSERARENMVAVVDELPLTEMKTKQVAAFLKKVEAVPGVLIVVPQADLSVARPVRNLAKASVLGADSLNVRDLLKYRQVLFLQKALAVAEKTFVKK